MMSSVTPRMCYFVTLLVVLLLGLATAQNVKTTEYSQVRTPKATGPNGEKVLAVSPILGRTTCNSPVFILRSGSSNCIAYGYPPNATVAGGPRYGSYIIEERGCPASVVGATNVKCVPDNGGECFIYNPANDKLIQWTNNTIRSTLTLSANISATLHPYIFAAFANTERSGSGSHLFFYAPATNKIWRAVFYLYTKTLNEKWEYFQQQPFVIPNEVTDIVEGAQFSIYIVQKGLSYLPAFEFFKMSSPISANFTKTTPEIGQGELQDTRAASIEDIQAGVDRFYINIYDEVCKCIQVYSYDTGKLMAKIPTNSTINIMSNSRSRMLAIDQYGFIKYEEEYRATVSASPYYCANNPGFITVDFRGGDFPVNLIAYPNIAPIKAEYAGSHNIKITSDPAVIVKEPLIVLDDDLIRTFAFSQPFIAQSRTWVNSSVIQPYSGTYSLRITLTVPNGASIGPILSLQTNINVNNVEYVEIWVNVGKGTQTFSICLRNQIACNFYKPGSVPPNAWRQLKWHLPSVKREYNLLNTDINTSPMIIFMFTAPAPKDPIYVDYIKLTPYTTIPPNEIRVEVYDSCSSLSMHNIPFTYQALKVSVESSPVSCHPNSTVSDALTADGSLVASVVNAAVGPITYNWGVNNGTISTRDSKIIGLKYMSNYITLYDESLNTSWSDVTTSRTYSLYATKYVHSGLYSISFTPSAENEALAFQIYPDVVSAEYPTIEFWINGGDVGQQTLRLILFKTTVAVGAVPLQEADFISTDRYLAPTANTWTKYSFTVPNNSSLRVYNMIAVSAYSQTGVVPPPPGNQPTVYIDDIIIIGKSSVLTVQDSRGCTISTSFAKIATPTPMKKEIHVVNAKCYNSNGGAVVVSMEGGTPPYNFAWSQGPATNRESSLSNLRESVVNVNITDAAGCRYLATSATVLQPPAIEISVVNQPPKCYGGTGQATATAKGGSGLYTYTWVSPTGRSSVILQPSPEAIFMDEISPFFTVENGNQVCSGTGSHLGYKVSASRSGYCALSLFSTFGANTTVSGHIHNQTYARVEFWLFTLQEDVFSNTFVSLIDAEGTYVPVMLSGLGTDLKVNQWNRFQLAVVASATGVVFSTTLPNVTVFVDDFVVIPIEPSGAGFSVLPGFQSLINLKADANYYLTVVDANGCSSEILTVNLTQPSAISIIPDVTGPSSNGTNDASIDIQVAGGTGTYRFLWVELGSEEQNPKALSPGEYKLKIWDANNCEQEFTVYVSTYNGIGERKVRDYNAKLSSGLAALVGIGFLVSLFSATMLYRYWESFSTLGSFLSCMILVGCVLSFLAALVLLPKPTDALCTSFIWFLGVGFVLVYGCLFIKTWALYNVWRNAVRCQKTTLTPLYIVKCLCMAVGVEVVFLAIWTAIDPPTARLTNSINNTSEYQCNTNNITFWIIFLAVKGAWLIFGAVLSVLTRNLAKEINESSSIAYAIYNNVLLCAIAIPLAALLGEIPGGRLTVEVVMICIAYCFTMIVVFFKIWHNIMLPEKIAMTNQDRKRNTASSTASMKSSFDRSSRDSRSPPISPSGSESRSDVYAL